MKVAFSGQENARDVVLLEAKQNRIREPSTRTALVSLRIHDQCRRNVVGVKKWTATDESTFQGLDDSESWAFPFSQFDDPSQGRQQ
jgi:hypothetical protein